MDMMTTERLGRWVPSTAPRPAGFFPRLETYSDVWYGEDVTAGRLPFEPEMRYLLPAEGSNDYTLFTVMVNAAVGERYRRDAGRLGFPPVFAVTAAEARAAAGEWVRRYPLPGPRLWETNPRYRWALVAAGLAADLLGPTP